jgi:hypothetical protein
MPQLPGGGENDSKRREVSLKGKGRASADGDNEGRAYLRSGVVDGSGWWWLLLCEDDGSYGGGVVKRTGDRVPGA